MEHVTPKDATFFTPTNNTSIQQFRQDTCVEPLDRYTFDHPGQQELRGRNLLFPLDQLLRVPVRPNKLVLQELCFRGSKPNEEASWKLGYCKS
jgi:hypothetical protein